MSSEIVWFTSDLHFGHKALLEYQRTEFHNVHEMDAFLISMWNLWVGKNDRVYHLGDFSFHPLEHTKHLLQLLNGRKYFINGNHDKQLEKLIGVGKLLWVKDLHYMKIDSDSIMLCHYPMESWRSSHYGSYMLHGHCHGHLPEDKTKKRVDVGVDAWGYSPVSWRDIKFRFGSNFSTHHHPKKSD